jgi:DNA polymerase-3 subunit alpha
MGPSVWWPSVIARGSTSDEHPLIVRSYSLLGDISDDGPVVSLVPPIPSWEWERGDKLNAERAVLGRYASDHPLRGSEHLLSRATHTLAQVLDKENDLSGQTVTIAGMITAAERKTVKRSGLPWCSAMLEDLEHTVEVTFFPQVYRQVLHVLAPDVILLVEGKVKEGATGVVASQIEILKGEI